MEKRTALHSRRALLRTLPVRRLPPGGPHQIPVPVHCCIPVYVRGHRPRNAAEFPPVVSLFESLPTAWVPFPFSLPASLPSLPVRPPNAQLAQPFLAVPPPWYACLRTPSPGLALVLSWEVLRPTLLREWDGPWKPPGDPPAGSCTRPTLRKMRHFAHWFQVGAHSVSADLFPCQGMCYNLRAVESAPKQVLAQADSEPVQPSSQPAVPSQGNQNQGARAEDASRYCPVCSQRLESRRCKLICSACGYYMSCSDYY